MRVLICVDALGAGGKERQLCELVKGLVHRPAFQCQVVCLDNDAFYCDELMKLEIPVEIGLRRRRWDVGVFQRLLRVVRRYRPDVIHTYDMMSSFYLFPIAKRLRIPLVNASIQNAFLCDGMRWRLERFLLERSDARIANSYAGLQSRGFDAGDTRNAVIANGFDLSRVEHVQHAPIAGAGTLRAVGMVASFSRYKDYPTFIQAARAMRARRNDVLFVAVGDGEGLERCKEMALDLPSMRFMGKRKNVEAIVASFDVGVLSTFTEGIPNAVMEYMALGKPVVATDGGGTRELIVNDVTGFLVPARNPGALAGKIEYLLDNPDVARRMGQAGYERLTTHFSLETMVEKTVQVYASVLTSGVGRRLPSRATALPGARL